MRKNFTKLVYAGIACFYMVSALAQEKMTVERIAKEKDFQKNEVELRAYNEYFWPDSSISYNSAGESTSKVYYDKENRTETSTWLENGSWKTGEPNESEGIHWWTGKVDVVEFNGKPLFIHPQMDGETNLLYDANFSYEHTVKVYDVKGNLTAVEFRVENFPDFYNEHRITYNDRNDPVLIELYSQKNLFGKIQYEYNESGYMTLHERYSKNEKDEWVITDSDYKQSAEYDELGRPVAAYYFSSRESALLNQWVLHSYVTFYYSDDVTVNEQIESESSTAYLFDRTLYIQSEKAEQITVYSITGNKLYETTIQPGMNTINAANFPRGVLFIKGSSGWTKKLNN